MGWTLFYMMVILKIPIIALCVIVYRAIKAVPAEEEQNGGGGEKNPQQPLRPRGRGPHGEPRPPAPGRIRTGTIREPALRD